MALDKGARGGGDEITRQVGRLSSLPGYRGPEEYAKVLRRVVRSGAHAEAVIDAVIASAKKCPPPVVLIELAGQIDAPSQARQPAAAPGCTECAGSPGWRYGWWLQELRGGIPVRGGKREEITAEQAEQLREQVNWRDQGLYDGVVKCACAGGRTRKPPQHDGGGGEDQSVWADAG